MRSLASLVFVAALLVPRAAGATWSIVAVDPDTQEVGVAVASCVEAPFGTTVLPEVVGLAPGIGALAAQARFDQGVRDQAVALLQMDLDAQAVIDTTNAADPQASVRQYGVVRLAGDLATYTGGGAQRWAGAVEGMQVTAQGNILVRPEVVGDALAAFEAPARQCPWTLADRLMVALEAGSAQGGDNRCSERQSALAATLKVARPGDAADAPYLDLRIASQALGGDNPVALLRVEYDAWRADNPPDDAACASGTSSTGDVPTSTTSTATSGGTGRDSTTGVVGVPGELDTNASGGSAGAGSADDSGCGCSSRTAPSGWGGLALLGLGFRPRRRRRRSRQAAAASNGAAACRYRAFAYSSASR